MHFNSMYTNTETLQQLLLSYRLHNNDFLNILHKISSRSAMIVTQYYRYIYMILMIIINLIKQNWQSLEYECIPLSYLFWSLRHTGCVEKIHFDEWYNSAKDPYAVQVLQ